MSNSHDALSAGLDRNDTTSPSQLQEVTLNPDFSVACYSPSNMSASQIRTMKDYEEQLGSLRKENFNLKLKVYFLEERLDASNSHSSQEDLLKKHIELKVNFEGLKKEINERQELLCAAARALELMEATAAQKENELQLKIASLEEELQYLRNTTTNDRTHLEDNVPAIDMNNGSIGIGADDSVALYMAAFNIPKFSISETRLKDVNKISKVCECRQLRALLTAERESATTLRSLVSSRDKEISQQQKSIEDLNERLKQNDSNKNGNTEVCTRNTDHEQVIEKLKQENLNACQMIQGCLVRIKQADKENKKLKMKLEENVNSNNETSTSESNDEKPQLLKKYKEMVEARDNKIADLENLLKSKNNLKDSSNENNSSQNLETDYNWMNSHLEKKIDILRESICVKPEEIEDKKETRSEKENLQKDLVHVLTSRLQEMAYFLDSLLSNRCILGEDKCRKVENLLEKSLELPIDIKLDPTASQFFDESYFDTSFNIRKQSLKLADLTKLFGHHMTFNDSTSASKTLNYYTKDLDIKKEFLVEIQQQNQEIEDLKEQLKLVQDHCICRSIMDESEGKTDTNIKSDPLEHNKSVKKSKPNNKTKKINKCNLNITWHGFEDFQLDQSESECWSEPDRVISLARMGGPLREPSEKIPYFPSNISSSDEEFKTSRAIEHSKSSSQEPQNALQMNMYSEDRVKIASYVDQMKMLSEKRQVEKSLEEANNKIFELENNIVVNKNQYEISLNLKQNEINSLFKKLSETEEILLTIDAKYTETIEKLIAEKKLIEDKLKSADDQVCNLKLTLVKEQQQFEQQRKLLQNEIKDISETSNSKIKEITERIETNWVSRVRYDALRHELDNAALQASQATLDRTVAAEQKMRSDTEAERLRKLLSDTRLKVSELENANAELQNRYVHMESWHSSLNKTLPFPGCDSDSPQRATSPDQGIDSDRLSSLEINEPASSHDDYVPAKDLATENAFLREKLERTQRTLENTLNRLNADSYREKKVRRAMCQEIHKTHSVLRQVRDNLTQ